MRVFLALLFVCSSVLAATGSTACDAIEIQNFETFEETLLGSTEPTWFSLHSTQPLSITSSTCNSITASDLDTTLTVYEGPCGKPSKLLTNDDDVHCQYGTHLSTLTWISQPETTYYLLLSTYGQVPATLDFALTVSSETVPSCSGVVELAGPYHPPQVFGFDLSEASPYPATLCNGVIPINTYIAWYTMYPLAGFEVDVSTCGSAVDTVLYIFNGECSDLNCVVSNDDSCGWSSSVSFVPDGNEYYIAVFGYANIHSGYVVVNVSQVIPWNLGCNLAWGPFTAMGYKQVLQGSTVNATSLSKDDPCGVSGPAQWFSFTAQITGEFTISTCSLGTSFITALSAYKGSCEELTCYAPPTPNDCSLGNFASNSFHVHAGDTFKVSLSGLYGASGDYDLSFIIE